MITINFTESQSGIERILDLIEKFKNESTTLNTEIICKDEHLTAMVFVNTNEETNITSFIYYNEQEYRKTCDMILRVNFEQMMVYDLLEYEINMFRNIYDIKDKLYEKGYRIQQVEYTKYEQQFMNEIYNIMSTYTNERDLMIKVATYYKKHKCFEKEINDLDDDNDTISKNSNKIYNLYLKNKQYAIEKDVENNLIRYFYDSDELKRLLNDCAVNDIAIEEIKYKLLSDYNCVKKIEEAYDKAFEEMCYRGDFEKYFKFLEAEDRKEEKLQNIVKELKNQFGDRKKVNFTDGKTIDKEDIYVKRAHRRYMIESKMMNNLNNKDFKMQDVIIIIASSKYFNERIQITKNNVREILEQTKYRNKMIFNIDKIEKLFEEVDE